MKSLQVVVIIHKIRVNHIFGFHDHNLCFVGGTSQTRIYSRNPRELLVDCWDERVTSPIEYFHRLKEE